MAIGELISIVPPPEAPTESQATDWPTVEDNVGAVLPDDYKAFVERYGTGIINDFLWILNPFSTRKYVNLLSQIDLQLSALKTLTQDFGEHCPYPLFPADEGLLPFAISDNGDVIYWLTEGNPNSWKIVVNDARSPRYEEFDGDMTSFLRKILTREIECTLFPRDFCQGAPSFESR